MAKRKKRSTSNIKAKSSYVTSDEAEVESILDEIMKHVDQGAKFKTVAADAKQAMRDDLQPRVATRISSGGKWAKEKAAPLLAASHVGEIAAILTSGNVIPKPILLLSYVLVKNTDEACKGTSGSGAGDWCA
jgi:hypothetical protein